MQKTDLGKTISQLGLNGTEMYGRIKLGNGVVGKVTNAIMALFAVMMVVAYGLVGSPNLLLLLAVGCAVLFLIYGVGVVIFAIRYPNLAALEGAELIAWRQMDMAASDPKVIEGAPNMSPPSQIGSE